MLQTQSKLDDSLSSADSCILPVAGHAGPDPQRTRFPDNRVKTSKYTAWDFVPRNLFEQLQQPPNLYFLVVGLLQIVPAVSTTGGIPTS